MKKLEEYIRSKEFSEVILRGPLDSTVQIGIGNDIVAVQRISDLINKKGSHFVHRCFTPAEIEYCNSKALPPVHFAGRWAAKEAVYKSLQLKWEGPFSWKEIEIFSSEFSSPNVKLSHKLRDTLGESSPLVLVSISHCSDYAFATALAIKNRRF